MTDKTMGIIRSIKQSGNVWNRAVAKFMSEYSGSPIEEYTETLINQILVEAFVDYISTCDNPASEVRDLLAYIASDGSHSIGYHIANVLGMAHVRGDNGSFVNGFNNIFNIANSFNNIHSM